MTTENPDYAIATIIGTNARTTRLSRRLTQKQVADRIGVSPEFYGRIDRGHAMPSVPTLTHMAEVLETSVGALLRGAEDVLDADSRHDVPRPIANIVALVRDDRSAMRLITAVIRALEHAL
jgi:transcriptional regulator with XRE-family HTH domain